MRGGGHKRPVARRTSLPSSSRPQPWLAARVVRRPKDLRSAVRADDISLLIELRDEGYVDRGGAGNGAWRATPLVVMAKGV